MGSPPWYCLIVGRVAGLDIIFRLTAAYPEVHNCFGTALRMGMMGWWRRAKATDSSLQIMCAAAKNHDTRCHPFDGSLEARVTALAKTLEIGNGESI